VQHDFLRSRSTIPGGYTQELARLEMPTLIQHFSHVFFLVYAGLFPIVNPLGNAPIFLALTRYCSDSERHALALRVAVNGFFLLLGSLLVGSYVLEFLASHCPSYALLAVLW
jgi:small neutral amino acid transporter SnatA (MarC family)